MHLSKTTWFSLYNEVKLKKLQKKKLQNKNTKMEFGFKLLNKCKLTISEKVFLKKFVLYKSKTQKNNLIKEFNRFFFTDSFTNYISYSGSLKKQMAKYNMSVEKMRKNPMQMKMSSNQFINFPNKVKSLYLSLMHL